MTSEANLLTSEERSQLTAILCKPIPEKFNNRVALRTHFSKFGQVEKCVCNKARESAVIHFKDHHSADAAKSYGLASMCPSAPPAIFWSQTKGKKKSTPVKPILPDLGGDLDMELNAMAGTSDIQEGQDQNLRRPPLESQAPLKRKAAIKTITSKRLLTETSRDEISSVPNTEIQSLKEELKKTAVTPGERFNVLIARDKMTKLLRTKQSDIATAKAVIGTCSDMCPEAERYMRIYQNRVHPYEYRPGTHNEPDMRLMVKEYSRSAADQDESLATDLRPANVLKTTMQYIVCNIMDKLESGNNVLPEEWFDFVWSRTRAIRKDITQQHLCDLDAVTLMEQCARFHIHSAARLCDCDVMAFDPRINTENLVKCLQSLRHFYFDLAAKGIYCENENEFRAYDILLNLSSGDVLWEIKELRFEVRKSPQVSLAIQFLLALHSNNYIRFFRLVRDEADYLTACIVFRYFCQIRITAIGAIVKAYCPIRQEVEIPLVDIVDLLCFEDLEEANDFIAESGLEIRDGLVVIRRAVRLRVTNINKMEMRRNIRFVESKRCVSVGEVMYGKALPPNPLDVLRVNSSFDANNFLILQSISNAGLHLGEPERPQVVQGAPFSFIKADSPVRNTTRTGTPPIFGGGFNTPEHTLKERSSGITPLLGAFNASFHTPKTTAGEFPAFRPFKPIVTSGIQPLIPGLFGAPPARQEPKPEDNSKQQMAAVMETAKVLLKEVLDEMIEAAAVVTVSELRTAKVLRQCNDDIFYLLFDEVLPVAIRECAESARKECLTEHLNEKLKQEKEERMRQVISLDIMDDIVDDVIRSDLYQIAVVEIREQRDRERRRAIVEAVCEQFIDDLIFDEIRLSVKNNYYQLVTFKLEKLALLRERIRWRIARHYSLHWRHVTIKRKKAKRLAQDFPSYLTPAVRLLEKPIDPDNILSPITELDNRKRFSRNLDVGALYVELTREISSTPFDLSKIICNKWLPRRAFSRNGDDLQWKLVISLPPIGLLSEAESVRCYWLVNKFNTEGVPLDFESNDCVTIAKYESKINESPSRKGNGSMTISVAVALVIGNLKFSRSDRSLLGLSGIIHVSAQNEPLEARFYRLWSILNCKPCRPKVPVLQVFLADSSQTGDDLATEFGYESLCRCNAWFADLVSCLVTSRIESISVPTELRLGEDLVRLWDRRPSLVDIMPSRQKLFHFLDDLVAKHFTPTAIDFSKKNQHLSNTEVAALLVELFNSVINYAVQIVCDNDFKTISWPIPEFTKDETLLLWNTDERFELLRSLIKGFQMHVPNAGLSSNDIRRYVSDSVQSCARDNRIAAQFRFNDLITKYEKHSRGSVVPFREVIVLCFECKLRQLPPSLPTLKDVVANLDIFYYQEKIDIFVQPLNWRIACMHDGAINRETILPTLHFEVKSLLQTDVHRELSHFIAEVSREKESNENLTEEIQSWFESKDPIFNGSLGKPTRPNEIGFKDVGSARSGSDTDVISDCDSPPITKRMLNLQDSLAALESRLDENRREDEEYERFLMELYEKGELQAIS